MPATTTTRGDQGFRTQAEAVQAARTAIWGDVHISKREFVDGKSEWGGFDHRGLPIIAVSANVNGHLFVIHFDHYGRVTQKEVIR